MERGEHIMQFFAWTHLPAHLAEVSKPFGELAEQIVEKLPRGPERTVALRKLLESKDAAVRARLAKGPYFGFHEGERVEALVGDDDYRPAIVRGSLRDAVPTIAVSFDGDPPSAAWTFVEVARVRAFGGRGDREPSVT